MKVKITHYESPLVLVGAFKAEQGFAQSKFGGANEAGSRLNENEDYSYDL